MTDYRQTAIRIEAPLARRAPQYATKINNLRMSVLLAIDNMCLLLFD